MTQWHEVRDSRTERPGELDTGSSSAVVYERRNIRQEERQAESGEARTVIEWVYDQRKYTKDEWSQEQTVKRALEGLNIGSDQALKEDVNELHEALDMILTGYTGEEEVGDEAGAAQ